MNAVSQLSPAELLPAREPESSRVHVIIDTPAGSRNKYKYDSTLHVFRVGRVLPLGMSFPHDFGSTPSTGAADGDALDVLVLGLVPTFPGCLGTVCRSGLLRAWQVESGRRIRNDRSIGVAETRLNAARICALRALDSRHLQEIEQFFEAYNRAQGRKFRIPGRGGRRAAESARKRAIRAFTAS
jgi:inorganic pyrophosphatase